MNLDTLPNKLYDQCMHSIKDQESAQLITRESCREYLTFFQNNADTAFLFLVVYPKEMATKTGMKFYLAKRILEDSSLNLIVCQSRVDLLLKLMHETGLNFEFSYQCLLEFKWNFPEAKSKVVKMKNNGEIPPRGFFNQHIQPIVVHPSMVTKPNPITEATNYSQPIIQTMVQPIQQPIPQQYTVKHEVTPSLEFPRESSTTSSANKTKSEKTCQYPGCSKDVEKSRKKYCAEHAAKPLKKESMSVDFVKCQHEGCSNPIAKYRKKYCEIHGNKK